ncbi:MAG: 1-deoxy-D-xylulose-5-phosphate reductoisomerase [Candidatus Cloacimonas sp. 4484_209]|nr:MAG: 1-deoxy-D-xylulose-5-phosphate reductoisomerase [Candidatus Cloacimonas sp. 4484_209]
MKKIAILGSTGSIGRNTLKVIKNLGDEYIPFALSCNTNAAALAEQALTYHPKVIAIVQKESAGILEKKLAGTNIKILYGENALREIVNLEDVDFVLNAIMGSAGFYPTLEAIKKGKDVALANKEALVAYGETIMENASTNNVNIIPVDSEHSAIFQCLNGRQSSDVKKLILTSSGGPFRERPDLNNISLKETLSHPVWNMGEKISVDSATMMNKALEIIEAHFLFNIPGEKISVVIHPECIIHSAVEFIDGSVIALLSTPDMKLPIQYSITYPERKPSLTKTLNLNTISKLTFEDVNLSKFPAINLAYRALEMGGTATAVLNASNEFLVNAFLNKKIRFEDIVKTVEFILNKHIPTLHPSIEQVKDAEQWAKDETKIYLKTKGYKL